VSPTSTRTAQLQSYKTPASGIGLATAQLFASKGWTVAIADLNVAAGEKYAAELKGSFHKTNVTDYDNLAQTFAQVWKKYGRLDMGESTKSAHSSTHPATTR
jgi:hypothetical protein